MNLNYREKIEAYFAANEENMIRDIKTLVEIPSARGEAAEGMPYGPGPLMVLRRAAEMLEAYGLCVKNWDNRVITGDLTDLESGLDILAHLDVVPAENNWTVCPPYEPVLLDGKLYGRGTIDNKGPAIAALYAMLCVRELGVPLKKNVRLILGSDEECGSGDVDYYYTVQPEAPMTYTPDAEFPVVNVEKGRLCGEIDGKFEASAALPKIISADCGLKTNIIPETATAVIAGMDEAAIAPYFAKAAEETGAAFTAEAQADGLHILCKGISGHAAFPAGTNNALTALLHLLASLPCAESEGFRQVCALQKLFPHGDYAGKALGIAQSDEVSGALTCCADLLHMDETSVYLCFDCRASVCATEENTKHVVIRAVEAAGLKMRDVDMILPHYVSGDSEFVQKLLAAYEAWSGKPGKTLSTGGGTYVHNLKNGVAFGCEMEGITNNMHGADEFITIEQLMLSAKIFAQAIIDLCC
ncbi:MAG: Sapep family Mn(2+)-dependent dipeptidase [Oscillospiraceae bacterium]|nr:Sapep family Mn(2+)-dependent dipeptidase [Oscillospiraceae bacterium]